MGPVWLVNAYLRVSVDTTTGDITRIYDKRNHREALAPGGRANVLQILDDTPAEWDAWNLGFDGREWDVTETADLSRHADAAEATMSFTRRWGPSRSGRRSCAGARRRTWPWSPRWTGTRPTRC